MVFTSQGKTSWKYILIILFLSIFVGGGILWLAKTQEIPFVQFPEIKKPEKVVKDETADWKTYINEKYRFEARYPQDWNIKEFKYPGRN